MQVSAVGVASEWRVWPLVALRVPHNATLQPLLTLYNPTDTTIQVTVIAHDASIRHRSSGGISLQL